MPNGNDPKSNDDKDWKLEVERVLSELVRTVNLMQRQVDELSRRK